jgi:hypothetical protein
VGVTVVGGAVRAGGLPVRQLNCYVALRSDHIGGDLCERQCRIVDQLARQIIGDLAALEVGQAVDRILPMELSGMNDHASLRIRMR